MTEIDLVKKIKEKKELSGLPDSYVLDSLKNELKKINFPNIDSIKKSEQKIIIKLVRAELRRSAGMFQKSKEKSWKSRFTLLEENKIEELLKTHSSTNERLNFYPKLKELIFSLKPSSILDLGCGINPIAIAKPNIKYYAVDIQQDDLDIVKKFFQKNNISGETFVQDISSSSTENLPSVDLCLMFKLLDILEKKGHRQAEQILKNIKTNFFIISFSTKTLSGRSMLHQKRPWLERILGKLNYHFKIEKSDNEIFYIIEK